MSGPVRYVKRLKVATKENVPVEKDDNYPARNTQYEKSISPPRKIKKAKPIPGPSLAYSKAVAEGFVALKKTAGSSHEAISEFIEAKHGNLPDDFKEILRKQLTSLAEEDEIVQAESSLKLEAEKSEKTTRTEWKDAVKLKEEKEILAAATEEAALAGKTTTTKKKDAVKMKSKKFEIVAAATTLVKDDNAAADDDKQAVNSSTPAAFADVAPGKGSTPAVSTRKSPRIQALEKQKQNNTKTSSGK